VSETIRSNEYWLTRRGDEARESIRSSLFEYRYRWGHFSEACDTLRRGEKTDPRDKTGHLSLLTSIDISPKRCSISRISCMSDAYFSSNPSKDILSGSGFRFSSTTPEEQRRAGFGLPTGRAAGPWPGRCKNEPEIVGVPLRRDIAEPGLGLGLGGQSVSVSSDPDNSSMGADFSDQVPSDADDGGNRSSFKIPDRLKEVTIRGFRPLSSTFFRALVLMQSTSWFITCRSEKGRRLAVRRLVLVRNNGVDTLRMGVENW